MSGRTLLIGNEEIMQSCDNAVGAKIPFIFNPLVTYGKIYR
jgi:hypothetical protein